MQWFGSVIVRSVHFGDLEMISNYVDNDNDDNDSDDKEIIMTSPPILEMRTKDISSDPGDDNE